MLLAYAMMLRFDVLLMPRLILPRVAMAFDDAMSPR